MYNTKREEHYFVVSLDGSFAEIYEDIYCPSNDFEYFSTRTYAYEYIAVKKDGLWGVIDYDGTADLLLVYEMPDDAAAYLKMHPTQKIETAPIGRDALVFIVNAQNPVDNLTTQ